MESLFCHLAKDETNTCITGLNEEYVCTYLLFTLQTPKTHRTAQSKNLGKKKYARARRENLKPIAEIPDCLVKGISLVWEDEKPSS